MRRSRGRRVSPGQPTQTSGRRAGGLRTITTSTQSCSSAGSIAPREARGAPNAPVIPD